jgi:citrate lyase subunit beta/citryl-CoA lyase
MVSKALDTEADTVIIDLEDAVAPGSKSLARSYLAALKLPRARHVMVRVNAVESSEFEEDVYTSIAAGAGAIVIPKTENPLALRHAETIAASAESAIGATSTVPFLVLIETAIGITNAFNLLAVDLNRTVWSAFGGGDYSLDLGLQELDDESELLWARSRLVAAARVNDQPAPLDTIYANFRDGDGFRKSSERSRALGFRGRMLIHPSQVEIANTIFDTKEDIEWARRMLELFETGRSQGRGSLSRDGRLIDYACVRRAHAILQREGLNS